MCIRCVCLWRPKEEVDPLTGVADGGEPKHLYISLQAAAMQGRPLEEQQLLSLDSHL